MTTSGVTTYQVDRDDLIEAALRKLGVLAIGQSPSSKDYTDGAQMLNMLVAQYRTIGMPLWARKTYTFNLTANTATYQIGLGKTLNTVYPLHLLQAYRVDSTSTTKINMDIIPNFNFNTYPTSSGGPPIQVTYQPFVNYGEISVWPTPDATAASQTTVTVVYQSPYQYFNSSTDTMDFPEEWYLAIVYNLALLLAPEWGISNDDKRELRAEANQFLTQAKEFSYEDSSLFIRPNGTRK